MLPLALTLRTPPLELPPGASEPWGGGKGKRRRRRRRERERRGQESRVKKVMSMLLMVAAGVTSSPSLMPLVSLIGVVTLPVLPVSLVPLPAAAEAAAGIPKHSYNSHFSLPSTHTSSVTPSVYSPSHSSVSTSPLVNQTTSPPLPSSPSNLQRGDTGPTTTTSVREGDGGKEKAVDNTSIHWAPEYTLGEDNVENTSSPSYYYYSYSYYYINASSSLPPCVPQEVYGNSSDVNDTCYLQESDRSSRVGALMGREWVRIVGFSLIFVVGVVGNVLVVVTLLHHRNLRSLTNVFLLNLAVSDLLLGVFCMPFTLVGSLLQDFVFGALMCRLIPYMQAVSVSVSVWTLVAISLERFYAICQPLRSRRWQTPSHAYRVIAGVWAASLLLMTPIAALSTLMPVRGDPGRHKCREVWASLEAERTFTILLTVLLLLVPLVVMAAAYLRVVRTLWLGPHLPGATTKADGAVCAAATSGVQVETVSPSRLVSVSIRFRRSPSSRPPEGSVGKPRQTEEENTNARGNTQQATVAVVADPRLEHVCYGSTGSSARGSRRWESESGARWQPLRSSQAQRSLVAKRRVVRMLFVLVAEFFICWTPLFMVNLLSLYIPRQLYAALGSFGVSLVQLLAYLSSCCNPLTYCFMNAKFIQSFKLAFTCTRRRPQASLRGVPMVSSFRSMGVSYHHDPASLRPSPGHSPACRNGATHVASQGTNV